MSVNPFLLQKQLRENASDLQDFAKDLQKWGEDMKRKEDSLKDQAEPPNKPKVRKLPTAKNKKQSKTSKARTGATDYTAWEKFDVDAELQKLEGDVNEDSELTDECNENMYDEAILEKEKGNKFVKTQNWDEAIKCYTKAIDCYSYDPIFYANRALCYLKKNMLTEAEKDCNLSLKLDQTYVKAYQRRAAARVGLNKLEHAEQDYLKVLELEPKNKETKKELETIRQKLNKSGLTIQEPTEKRPVSKFTASRTKSVGPSMSFMSNESQKINTSAISNSTVIDDSKPSSSWLADDIIVVKAINKKPHLRSQKPLKRVEIIEIKNEEPIEIKESNEAIKTHVVENKPIVKVKDDNKIILTNESINKEKDNKIILTSESINKEEDNKLIEHLDSTEETKESLEVVSEFKKKQNLRNMRNSPSTTAWPKPNQQNFSIKSDDFKIIEKNNPKEEKNIINSDKKYENDDSDRNYIVPKNSVQFFSGWKNLKTTEEKYSYLREIDPPELPKIFQSSLDSSIFSNIIEVLAADFIQNKVQVSKILNYLSQVKRFSTFTMFLTDDDKSNLWKLFDYIKETKEVTTEEVDRLIHKYEL